MQRSPDNILILAAASAGGHWEQMQQIRPAFAGARVVFATTDAGLAAAAKGDEVVILKDYSQTDPIGVLKGLFETRALVRRLRPDVVISTGAAPGLLCLLWGRILGARTIWLDSIANAERLSLSGRLARRFSSMTLTQWENLAEPGKIEFWGSVL